METWAQSGGRTALVIAALAGCLLPLAAERPATELPAKDRSTKEEPPAQESISSVIDVLPAELNAQPPGANWLSYNGDFTGRRYSSLSQINTGTVGQLRAQWVFHSNSSDRMEVTPVVVNGTM